MGDKPPSHSASRTDWDTQPLASATAALIVAPATASIDTVLAGALPTESSTPYGLIAVGFQDPAARLIQWAGLGTAKLDGTAVVRIGADSPTSPGEPDISDAGLSPRRTAVADPEDFTQLGVTLTTALENIHADSGRPLLLFDSLTGLLQYGDVQTVFRFLHVLIDRIRDVEGLGLFLFDEAAHDSQTLATLRQLFDVIVTVGSDGAVTNVQRLGGI